MRIGFDAKRAFQNFTGLGNYSRSVMEVLLRYFPDNSYYYYTPKNKTNNQLSFLEASKNWEIHSPETSIDKLLKSKWRTFGIAKLLDKHQIDLFHGLTHELPVGIEKTTVKSVVTIHDLIFLRYPENYSSIDRNIYKKKIVYACDKADRIVAISQQTKNDIVDFLGVDETKIDVVYQTCHKQFMGAVTEAEIEKVMLNYGFPKEYMLSVGTIEKRKNLLSVIKALSIGAIDIPLVVIGKETSYVHEVKKTINELGLENQIIFMDKVDFKDLPAIYQNSKFFIYPSFFEGFGIPILEALYSRVPVITTEGGCFTEVGGEMTMYIDPDSPENIATAINKIASDSKLYDLMKNKGFEFAQQFSENAFAEGLMDVYKKC